VFHYQNAQNKCWMWIKLTARFWGQLVREMKNSSALVYYAIQYFWECKKRLHEHRDIMPSAGNSGGDELCDELLVCTKLGPQPAPPPPSSASTEYYYCEGTRDIGELYHCFPRLYPFSGNQGKDRAR
jgi:hypothetical protein